MEPDDLESIAADTPCPFVFEPSDGAVSLVTAELLNEVYLHTGIYPQEILDPEFISLYEIVIRQGDNWCKWPFCDEVLTKVRKIEESYRDMQFDVYKSHLIAEQLLKVEESTIQDIYEHLVNEKRVSQLNGEIVTSEDHSKVPWVNKQSLEWYVVQRGCLVSLINEALTNSCLDNNEKGLVVKQLVEKYHKEGYSSLNPNQAKPNRADLKTSEADNKGKETVEQPVATPVEDFQLDQTDIAEKMRLVEMSGYQVIKRGSHVVDIREFIRNRSLDEAQQLIKLLGNKQMFPVAGNIIIEYGATRRSIVFAEAIPNIYIDLILSLGYRLSDTQVENGCIFVNTLRGQRTPTFLDVLEEINSEVKATEKVVTSKKLNGKPVTPQKRSPKSNIAKDNSIRRNNSRKSPESDYDAQLRKRRESSNNFWGGVEVEEDGAFGEMQKPSRSGLLGQIIHELEIARITPVVTHSTIVPTATSINGHVNEGVIEFGSIDEIYKTIQAATIKLSEAVFSNGGKINSLNVHHYRQEVRCRVLMFIQAVTEQEKMGELKAGELDELFTKLGDEILSAYQKKSPKLLRPSSQQVLPDIKDIGAVAEVILSNTEFEGYRFSRMDPHASFQQGVLAKMQREGGYPDVYFYQIFSNRESSQSNPSNPSIHELRRITECGRFKVIQNKLETIFKWTQKKTPPGRLFLIESQEN